MSHHPNWFRRALASAILTYVAAPSLAAEQHYIGTAYAASGATAVYREEHWVYEDAGTSMRLVLYRCPAGAPFARKLVREAESSAPDFELIDARGGYREGVRRRDGKREVYVQKSAEAALKTAPLPARAGGVIDAGFDAYVRGHWNELAGKDGLTIPFLVPSRFDYLDLKLVNASENTDHGEPVRHIRMTLAAWYGFVAPAIDLTYTQTGHRLLRFQGTSNVRDAAGKNQSVRIEFPASGQLAPASRAEIDAAAALPLVQKCPG